MNSRELAGPLTSTRAPLARCLLVWLAATAALAGVVIGLAPRLGRARELSSLERLDATPFDSLLLTGSAVAIVVCGLWLWVTSSLVALEAVTGRSRPTPGCPSWLRRLVLLGCGLALASSVTPAMATTPGGHTGPVGSANQAAVSQVAQPVPADAAADRAALAGLEVPDRVVVGEVGLAPAQGTARVPDAVRGSSTVVAPGDSLWRIAGARIPGASDAAVSRLWQEIWHLNRSVIGPDPDLIHPGTRLQLPATKESR